MMTSREAFIQTWGMESASTQRVLKAVPEKNLSYKPDPKSRTGIELAVHVAGHSHILATLLGSGEITAGGSMPTPKTAKEAAGIFDAALPRLQKTVSGMSDKTWDEKMGKMVAPDGSVLMSNTLGSLAWFILYDLIHHRGQLAAYLRAMGGKVPSIYGPSADDPGQM